MNNFDLNKFPKDEEYGVPEEDGVLAAEEDVVPAAKENEIQQTLPAAEEMNLLSASLLEIIFIFTAIYFPIVLQTRG